MTPFDKFISLRFTNLYGEPNAADPTEFIAEYRKALANTRADILEKASNYVVKNHAYPTWPTIGECKSAIELIAGEINSKAEREANLREQAERRRIEENWPKPSPKVVARVDKMVADLKRTLEAADSGVIAKASLPKTDRKSWSLREMALRAAGKIVPSDLTWTRAA